MRPDWGLATPGLRGKLGDRRRAASSVSGP